MQQINYEQVEEIFNKELAKEKKINPKGKSAEYVLAEVIANNKIEMILRRTKERIKRRMEIDEGATKKIEFI